MRIHITVQGARACGKTYLLEQIEKLIKENHEIGELLKYEFGGNNGPYTETMIVDTKNVNLSDALRKEIRGRSPVKDW